AEHEDEPRGVHPRAHGALPDALGAAPRAEAHATSHEGDRKPERGALEQPEPEVLEDIEDLETFEELGGRELEQGEAGEPSGDDAGGDGESDNDGEHR